MTLARSAGSTLYGLLIVYLILRISAIATWDSRTRTTQKIEASTGVSIFGVLSSRYPRKVSI
jgi:hypothetical protein